MQAPQPAGQDSLQGQIPYSLPPAPTFASLGANSMPFTGTLGSLAQGHQQQQPPATQPGQGLSAAIPPSAYLMAQAQHQQSYPAPPSIVQEKRASKKEDSAFGLILPLHKVKRLIKSENSVKAVSGEASFAIARATELFVEQLVNRSYGRMISEGRDMIHYDDVAHTVSRWPATDFLRDVVPETMSLNELMEMAKREDAAEEG